MPLAILEAVPDSPIRQEILQNYRDNLAQGNRMDPMALLRLIGSSPYGLETTHRVGEILYRVGYELLEKAANGQLRKVERGE